MNPKNYKLFFKNIAKEADVHPRLVDDLISFYYGKVRKHLSELEYPRIYLHGLGTFSLRKTKLENSIKRHRDMLGNLEKMTYKGWMKHVPIKKKLDTMEKALETVKRISEEKIEWKEKKRKKQANS